MAALASAGRPSSGPPPMLAPSRCRPDGGLRGEMADIDVEGLVKRYGAVVAVDRLTFAVEKGEVFGMLGPNGAGKTTTLEIIEGLRTPDAGSVHVLGTDVLAHPSTVKERIGVQPRRPRCPSSPGSARRWSCSEPSTGDRGPPPR